MPKVVKKIFRSWAFHVTLKNKNKHMKHIDGCTKVESKWY